jgi:PLP dependent protein
MIFFIKKQNAKVGISYFCRINVFRRMTPAEIMNDLKSRIPQGVRIVAVSKTQPVERIREIYDTGHRIFGENRVQEITEKQPVLPADIEWHFIGHLQTNKVKYIVPFISCIHSIDSARLLEEVDKAARKSGRVIDCLLQFHIATEETKYGFDLPEAEAFLRSAAFREMKNIRITGVMGMATFTDDTLQVRKEFRALRHYFDQIKSHCFPEEPAFLELSMGMSGDYPIAVEEGSTLVRIGTAIFGERHYL